MSIYNFHTCTHTSTLVTLWATLMAAVSLPANAVNLNYERLSSLEKPLAAHYGDTTLVLTGLTDASFKHLKEPDDNSDFSLLANFQLSAETQLANSWTLGAAYFGQYQDINDDRYYDNAALYLGSVWGTATIGNVSGLVNEQTRRARGAGNAELSFDDHLGQLSDVGVNYIGRFGPSQLLATIDENGDFDIASIYQRPLDNKDYRFSVRYRQSQFSPASGTVNFDSNAVSVVGELTYGSTIFDIGLGVEQLSSDSVNLDRRTVSVGSMRKTGLWTFSGEAHFGDIEGQQENAYALGLKYDVARGMSVNLGINHSDANVNVNGVSILQQEQTEGRLSFRYSF
mgnify:FL=1